METPYMAASQLRETREENKRKLTCQSDCPTIVSTGPASFCYGLSGQKWLRLCTHEKMRTETQQLLDLSRHWEYWKGAVVWVVYCNCIARWITYASLRVWEPALNPGSRIVQYHTRWFISNSHRGWVKIQEIWGLQNLQDATMVSKSQGCWLLVFKLVSNQWQKWAAQTLGLTDVDRLKPGCFSWKTCK